MSADPNLACGVLDSLGRFWLDMCFTDLVVTVDQIPFHCHKFHLCACSALFNTLLNTENADGSKNSINHVIITGISLATFENVLRTIYKGENVLDENNMIPLWYAALQLKVNVLVPKCEEFIISRLTLKNYENLYLYAILVGSNRVVNSVLEFMANNFEHFRQTSTFLDLPTDHLKVIVDKLANIPLSRDTIVSPILLWASHITADDDGNVGQRRWDLLSYVPTKYKEGKFSLRSTETGTIGTENVTESAEAKSEANTEVTFTKPPLPITEESSKQELREVFRLYPNQNRCRCLGDLLQNVQLERASADYLKSLTNDDWLMSIKEARDVVWNAVVAQKCLEGNAAAKNGNTSSVPSDLPHVKCAMVYKALPQDDGPYAYRLDTDKLYRAPSPAGTFETVVGGYPRPLFCVVSLYNKDGHIYRLYIQRI